MQAPASVRAHLNCHMTQSAELLRAAGGDDQSVIRAASALGYARLGATGRAEGLGALKSLLSAQTALKSMAALREGSAPQRAAVNTLREAAEGYARQGRIDWRADAGRVTATQPATTSRVGTPANAPPGVPPPRAPKANPWTVAVIQKDVALQAANQKVDKTLDRFVYAPWDRFVAQPTAAGAAQMYERFQQTPVGQAFHQQVSKVPGAVQSVIAENKPVGKLLKRFDEVFIKNDKLWDTVDKAGAVGRKVALSAAGTTAALIANAYRTGTLQTGTFNTSGNLTPAQLQMVKSVNIPPNMNVRYYTVPTTIKATKNGQTFNVKAAATIVTAEGSNIVFLPALGPGKPGAQPWTGAARDGGATRNEKQIVAASSSVAAAKWNLVGFSLGTSNFNSTGRADVQLARGLGNILAIQGRRFEPPAGQKRVTAQSILIFDPVSTYYQANLNVGPVGLVVARNRGPQTEWVTLPNGKKTITFPGTPHKSSVQPALPVLGASTWDPTQDDIRLFKAWFGEKPKGPASNPAP